MTLVESFLGLQSDLVVRKIEPDVVGNHRFNAIIPG
jgi:hypothetical protein